MNSYFQGEICVASSRVFVQEGIYDEFVKKLKEKAKDWVVGDPFDPRSRLGPQVGNDHGSMHEFLFLRIFKKLASPYFPDEGTNSYDTYSMNPPSVICVS